MAGETFPLGPGTLSIGAVGTEIDVSVLTNNCTLTSEKDQGDSVTKLDGTVVPGAVTYTYNLTGNIDIDIIDAAGLFKLSHDNPGSEQSFIFEPNTAAGTAAAGTLILDPLDFGGDETGTTMASDFEFAIVGEPAMTYGPPIGMAVGAEE